MPPGVRCVLGLFHLSTPVCRPTRRRPRGLPLERCDSGGSKSDHRGIRYVTSVTHRAVSRTTRKNQDTQYLKDVKPFKKKFFDPKRSFDCQIKASNKKTHIGKLKSPGYCSDSAIEGTIMTARTVRSLCSLQLNRSNIVFIFSLSWSTLDFATPTRLPRDVH